MSPMSIRVTEKRLNSSNTYISFAGPSYPNTVNINQTKIHFPNKLTLNPEFYVSQENSKTRPKRSKGKQSSLSRKPTLKKPGKEIRRSGGRKAEKKKEKRMSAIISN